MLRSPLFAFALLALILSSSSLILANPLQDAINYIDSLPNKSEVALGIYHGRSITYNPGRDAQHLNFFRTEKIIPLLYGQSSKINGRWPLLAAVGTHPSHGTRFAAWTTDPFRVVQTKPAEWGAIMLQLESMAWAMGDVGGYNSSAHNASESVRTVTFSFMSSNRNTWTHATTGVFKKYFPNWTVVTCDVVASLETCLQSGTVHIFGSSLATNARETVGSIVAARHAQGFPLIYVNDYTWRDDNGGASIALGFNTPFQGLYWNPQSVVSTPSQLDALNGPEFSYADFRQMLVNLRDETFTFNVASCGTDEGCAADPRFGAELSSPTTTLRSTIKNLENAGFSPADEPTTPLMNKLVLAGDYARSFITYPILGTNNATVWARAYIADSLYCVRRSTGPAQPDLGDYGKHLNNTIPRTSKIVTFKTRKITSHPSSTVYAAPGDTVTITRLDSNVLAGDVAIYVNRMRYNVFPIKNKRLNRPQYLWGNEIPVKPGQPITINTAIGGVIYVVIPTATQLHTEVRLKFENFVQHPVYHISSGNDTQPWKDAVQSQVFPWSEIVHPHLQIRLQWTRGVDFLNEFGTQLPSTFQDFETYLYDYHYKMAGFWSSEVPIAPLGNVAAECAAFGLRGMNYTSPQHEYVEVQHMNADRYSICGSGCSGNPIDLNWKFGVIRWGEHHELGHNIQYNRFRIGGSLSGEVSNNIFPLSVNIRTAYDKNNFVIAPGSERGPRTDIPASLRKMRDAIASNSTPASVGLVGSDLGFYTTLIFSSGDRFGEWGFEMVPLMYLMSRNIDAEKSFAEAKDNYGLSLYTSMSEIDSGPSQGADFLLLSVSWINKLDYRSFFWSWGISWSPKVDQQIEAWNFNRKLPKFVYPNQNFTAFPEELIEHPYDPYYKPQPVPMAAPVEVPSAHPVAAPAAHPVAAPVEGPSFVPETSPTTTPAVTPHAAPSSTPSSTPVAVPSSTPSSTPVDTPNETPVDIVPLADPPMAAPTVPFFVMEPETPPSSTPSSGPITVIVPETETPSSTPDSPSASPTVSPQSSSPIVTSPASGATKVAMNVALATLIGLLVVAF